MPTWSGWQNQFLERAGIMVTPPNRDLLDSWAKNAASSCRNNPIDLTPKLAGSTPCHLNSGIHTPTQSYTSHAQAATAFRDEIHEDFAKQLLAAMNTGNPYQVSYANDVASVFVSWGSPKMLNVYGNAAAVGGPGSGPGTGGPTDLHHGWTSIRRSLNHNWVKQLRSSDRNVQAALRTLGHSHRVHK